MDVQIFWKNLKFFLSGRFLYGLSDQKIFNKSCQHTKQRCTFNVDVEYLDLFAVSICSIIQIKPRLLIAVSKTEAKFILEANSVTIYAKTTVHFSPDSSMDSPLTVDIETIQNLSTGLVVGVDNLSLHTFSKKVKTKLS